MVHPRSSLAQDPADILIGVGSDLGAALRLTARSIFATHLGTAAILRAHGATTTRVVVINGNSVTDDQQIVPQRTYGIVACVPDQPALDRLENFLTGLPKSSPLKQVPIFARFPS